MKLIDISELTHFEVQCSDGKRYVLLPFEHLSDIPVVEAELVINHYKNKACELIKGNCDKCEAAYEYHGKKWCCFDTTTRFVEWNNKYNT
jgi:hypothetical protein